MGAGGRMKDDMLDSVVLKDKQARFVSEYLIDGNATRAAKDAGYTGKYLHTNASKLLENTTIAAAIKAGQKEIAKRNELTIDDIIKELEEARTAALTAESPQSSAAVAATMGKAKLLGLIIDKSENKHEGNVDIEITFGAS